MLLAPACAVPTASSSSGATSSDRAPRKCRAAPSVASATARQADAGSSSSSTALRAELLGGREIAGPVGQRRAQHRHAGRRRGAALDEAARRRSAAAVASAQRSAAACSPESSASQARARHSRGSLVTSSAGSASSQRITVAPRPVCSQAFHDRAIRSAANASWPAASRWATALETSPVRGGPGAGAGVQLAMYSAEHVSASSRRRTSRNTWW